MKAFLFPMILFFFFVCGCAHSPNTTSLALPVEPPHVQQVQAGSSPVSVPTPPPEMPVPSMAQNEDEYGDIIVNETPDAETKKVEDYGDIEETDRVSEEAKIEIADPLEPFNRAMYHFNDKLYFWVLKPVAQGYGKVVPEPARVSISNFFTNLAFPIRFVNCLLQANFSGAATELGRFMINTLWGIGGLLDPAASEDIDLSKQDEDFGQTLGSYGLGQGFFINWPLFGPSSLRDTVGLVGDAFLTPASYLSPWYAGAGARGYERVNDTSLQIGDYESLKEAAIDPYIAIRDAYIQYRLNKVNRKGGNVPRVDAGLPKK